MKSNHRCIIGLLHKTDYSTLATLNDLYDHIAENIEFNRVADMYGYKHKRLIRRICDYADRRKATDLCQFDFCPECGKKIDWKQIRRIDNAK